MRWINLMESDLMSNDMDLKYNIHPSFIIIV